MNSPRIVSVTIEPLGTDVDRCEGVRFPYTQLVRPIEACTECRRWLEREPRPVGTKLITPGMHIVSDGSVVSLACPKRIAVYGA